MKLWCPDCSVGINYREEGLPPMRKGEVVDGHDHNYGHMTLIPRGGFLFEALDGPNGKVLRSAERWATSPRPFIVIEAKVWHRLTCLEDGSLYYCVYAHRDPDGAVIEKFMGWTPAYE